MSELPPNGVGTLRLAVRGMTLVALVAIAGIIYLLGAGKEAPEGLIALASAAVGGLGTLLAHQSG